MAHYMTRRKIENMRRQLAEHSHPNDPDHPDLNTGFNVTTCLSKFSRES